MPQVEKVMTPEGFVEGVIGHPGLDGGVDWWYCEGMTCQETLMDLAPIGSRSRRHSLSGERVAVVRRLMGHREPGGPEVPAHSRYNTMCGRKKRRHGAGDASAPIVPRVIRPGHWNMQWPNEAKLDIGKGRNVPDYFSKKR